MYKKIIAVQSKKQLQPNHTYIIPFASCSPKPIKSEAVVPQIKKDPFMNIKKHLI